MFVLQVAVFWTQFSGIVGDEQQVHRSTEVRTNVGLCMHRSECFPSACIWQEAKARSSRLVLRALVTDTSMCAEWMLFAAKTKPKPIMNNMWHLDPWILNPSNILGGFCSIHSTYNRQKYHDVCVVSYLVWNTTLSGLIYKRRLDVTEQLESALSLMLVALTGNTVGSALVYKPRHCVRWGIP